MAVPERPRACEDDHGVGQHTVAGRRVATESIVGTAVGL
jgi:hypothetical protein